MSAVALPSRRLAGFRGILAVWLRAVRYWGPTLLLLAATVVVLVGLLGERRFLLPAAEFCSVVCLACFWVGLFAVLQRQNHPLTARLLPGQLQYLREVAVLGFLFTVLSCAALVAMSPLPVSFTAAVIVATLGAGVLAVLVRWPWLWIVGWSLSTLLGASVPGTIRAELTRRFREVYDDQPVSMAAFILVMAALGLWRLFQSGGPRHARSWKRNVQVQRLLKMQSAQAPSASQSEVYWLSHWEWIGRLFAWLRTYWLGYLLRHARPTARSAVARAELAANSQTHWSMVVGATLLVSAAVGLALAVTLHLNRDAHEVTGMVARGLAFGVLAMLMNPLLSTTNILVRRKREQALLVLLPGVPRGQALNRQLAKRQMFSHVLHWMVAVTFLPLLPYAARAWTGGDPGWAFWGHLAQAYAAVLLPLGVMQWRNWAAQEEIGPVLTVLGVTAMGVLCVGLALLLQTEKVSPVHVFSGSVLLTLMLMAVRWRSINRYPSFWPVGRQA